MKLTKHIILLFWLISMPTLLVSQTYGTNLDNLFLMDFTPGACSATLIGPFTDSGTGANLKMADIALCPDGILYGMSIQTAPNALYEINPSTAEATLIVTTAISYSALACSPDFRLFGIGGFSGGNVIEFFVGSMTSTIIGNTGFVSSGDLVFYNDNWYNTVSGGLLKIPNIDSPGTNELIYDLPPYFGLTVSPTKCNTLIVPSSEYSELDLFTGELTPICNIGQIGREGLTSMFEFQASIPCPLLIDLDDDDSSGLTGSDYNGDSYTCVTDNGLSIADEDVQIKSLNQIVDITININLGLLDSPDEILVLNTANNITITGSGTEQIVLSSIGGTATSDDFEMAISNMRYFNQKPYPTPGVREIKVVFEDIQGAISNEAFGYVTVTQYEDVIVDLGPDMTLCEDEVTILDAGPGDTYNWSSGEMNQSITSNDAGIYSVTVTEGTKCPDSDSIEIIFLPLIDFTLSIEGSICSGENVIIYPITDYDGIFDIEIKVISTNDLHYFQNIKFGDALTIPIIESTFLQITQIIPQIEDICPVVDSGLTDVLVNDEITEIIEASICQNDSIFYRGEYLKEAGQYLDTVVSPLACDSLIILNLEVNPLYLDTIMQFSCDSADVGIHIDTLSTIFGCDSIINLDISLSPTHDTTVVSTSCDFEQVIDTVFNLTNQYGCDSIVHSIVNYALSDTTMTTTFTCNPTEVDTVIQALVSMDGCDSIAVNFIVLVNPDTTYLELITCDPGGVGLTINMEMNVNGCDSLIYENYTYQEPSTENIQNIVCDPTNQGVHIDTLLSMVGCDSLYLSTENTYIAPDTIMTSQSSCDSLIVGVSYNSLINIYGCDSIIEEVTISYLPLDTIYLQQTTCNSALIGTNIDIFITTENCDSIVKTEVLFTPLDTTYIFDTSCNLDSVGIDYTIFNTVEGCDSIVKSEINYTPLDTTYIFGTSCNLDSVGVDYILINTIEGCDSIIKSETTYTPLDTTYIFDTSCQFDSIGTNFQLITTADGCDSIIAQSISYLPIDTTFNIIETCDFALNNNIDTIIFQTGECDSIVIESNIYMGSDTTFISETTCIQSEAVLSTINLSNIDGCDSTIVIDIELLPTDSIFITDTICYISSDSIEVFQLINQFGCDSIITIENVYQAPTLDLGSDQSIILGDEVVLEVNTSIIDGDLFWSSEPLLDQGDFDELTIMPEEDITITLEIQSSEGCSATDQLNIDVEKSNTLIFPNVFSPNDDGVNDIFTFNLEDYEIESIESLSIFDRWGNKVYSIKNIDKTIPFGWDGTMNNKEIPSGVYVLYCQLRMQSGESMNIVQDLTVLH